MPEIRAGQIVLFYLFDIAETVDLSMIGRLVGVPTVPARLQSRQATPSYVQYDNPPVSFDGGAVGVGDVDGFRVRLRLYDYGVLSIGLTRAFQGEWDDLVALGPTLVESVEFQQRADGLCRTVCEQVMPALVGYRNASLGEDYLVYLVHELDRPQEAEELLATRGSAIAAMLRGEARSLSIQERETVLGRRISYLADDLVIPTWNASFVYDTRAGAAVALEIIEFANSQLLEFRYYDQLLDRELGTIYARLQRPRPRDQWIGSRYTRAARQVHALFIDVNEVTDRTENALKFIDDIYAARLFALVADRLGLGTWKANVEGKLKTLDDIYRFAVEESAMARGQMLELSIVLILLFELALFFMGIMQ